MDITDLFLRRDQKQYLSDISKRTNLTENYFLQQGLDCLIDKHPQIKTPETFLVCGGTGYIGTALVNHLRNKGKDVTVLKTDLTNPLTLRQDLAKLDTKRFDVGYNLAADVGGIGYTSNNQLDIFYKNFSIVSNYFEYVHPICDYTIQTSSACIYPSSVPYPTSEKYIGLKPDEQVLGYGLAKLFMLKLGNQLKNVTTLILTNVYGEYLDSCESFGEKSHVTAALIKKFVDAERSNLTKVELWGDGLQTRDFVHIKDVVNALDCASIKPRIGVLDGFNIANSIETPIKELAAKISKFCGFKGKIVWDTSKPKGVERRLLDTSKARNYFNWKPGIRFENGLEDEILFYLTILIRKEYTKGYLK